SEGHKLRITIQKPGEVLGYSGLMDNVDATWDRNERRSPSGFTATPTLPGSPSPSDKLTLVFATQNVPGGKRELVLQDLFAGEYAPSGLPSDLSALLVSGAGMNETKAIPINDKVARQKRAQARERA